MVDSRPSVNGFTVGDRRQQTAVRRRAPPVGARSAERAWRPDRRSPARPAGETCGRRQGQGRETLLQRGPGKFVSFGAGGVPGVAETNRPKSLPPGRFGAKNSFPPRVPPGFQGEMSRGPSRIRTGDGGFAIRCLTAWRRGPGTFAMLASASRGVNGSRVHSKRLARIVAASFAGIGRQAQCRRCSRCHPMRCSSVAPRGMRCFSCQALLSLGGSTVAFHD